MKISNANIIIAQIKSTGPASYIGRSRDDDLRPGLRSFHAGEYIIIYRVEDDEDVRILHVMRASRDVKVLLRHRAD